MGRVSLSLWNASYCDSFRSTHRARSFENSSAPFNINEYDAVYKQPEYFPWNFNKYQDWSVCIGLLIIQRVRVTDDQINLDRQFQERIMRVPHILFR